MLLPVEDRCFLSRAVLAISLFCPFSISAQEVPRLDLKIKGQVPVAAGLVRSMAGSPECDSAGNIYIQFVEPYPADSRAAPVIKISPDGKHLTSFSLKSVPGATPESSIDSFTVTPRGEVFLLGFIGEEPQFVTFDDDGQFKSVYKIDVTIASGRFAAFSTGEFLLRGIKVSRAPRERNSAAFTGLFDRDGKFLKQVSTPDEIPFRERSEFTEAAEFRKQQRAANEAVWNSQAISADDENVYLVRPATPISVDVISPAGEVVRRLKLNAPDTSFRAGSVKEAGGKIVVEFLQKVPGDSQNRISDVVYSLFDAGDGEKLYDYHWPSGPEGFFACYSPNYFTFLNVDDNGLSLIRAAQ